MQKYMTNPGNFRIHICIQRIRDFVAIAHAALYVHLIIIIIIIIIIIVFNS